jgi:hypothetical protein
MKKPLITWSSLLIGTLAFCSLAAPAHAQENAPPPSSPPPSSPPPSGGGLAGGAIGLGAMVSFAPANAGDVLFVYDTSMFDLDAALGYGHASQNNVSTSDFRFGIGGWYHLARGSMADFSIGGTVGLLYNSGLLYNGSYTSFAIDPGAQARLFLSPNFALLARFGVDITFGDNNQATTFNIGGATFANFGFAYFFR